MFIQRPIDDWKGFDIGGAESKDKFKKAHHDTVGRTPEDLCLFIFFVDKARQILGCSVLSIGMGCSEMQPIAGIVIRV